MKMILSVISIFLTFSAFSAELDGIKFEDKIKLENKDLVLNGIGIRKATIFKVKVYYGGFYLEAKSSDAKSFIASNTPKQIVMNFVHDVEAQKLRSGFNDGMAAANKNADNFKSQMEKFNSCVTDVVKGDKFIVNFLTDGVMLNAKGKACEKIPGADFSKALLSIWFINPADENLSKGLLGQSI
jgi:hypothetical protein